MGNGIKYGFPTVCGRGLLGELKNFVHRPFLIVTMSDLWQMFAPDLRGADYHLYEVTTIDREPLEQEIDRLPAFEAVVGLGGGQALDVAKYIAWRRRRPLFQVPTALSANAVYGHRSGIRDQGKVVYQGWAIPESVFIDYDIIRAAPKHLNYSGIGDILCFHTGVLDWRYAWEKGQCEAKWPYEPHVAEQSLAKVEQVVQHATEIRDLTPLGIEVLVDGLKWGTTYHGFGWCPRHIEGIDHFFFYALEVRTKRKFLHGQPVCFGVYLGSLLHDSRADEMLETIAAVGLDIRPEAMGVSWTDIEQTAIGLQDFMRQSSLWHSIAHDIAISPSVVQDMRSKITEAFGVWGER